MSGKTTIAPHLNKTSVFLGKDGKKIEKPNKRTQPKRQIRKFGANLKQL